MNNESKVNLLSRRYPIPASGKPLQLHWTRKAQTPQSLVSTTAGAEHTARQAAALKCAASFVARL